MKRYILMPLLLCLLSQGALAQFSFGVRAGVISVRDFSNPITVIDDVGKEIYEVGLQNAKLGFTGGLVFQFQFGSFIIQPEALISFNRYEYAVEDLSGNIGTKINAEEKYQYFDVPLLIGFKIGPVRLQAGPEAHVYLNSTSELADLDFYKKSVENFTLGWAGNIGVDIGKIMLDFRFCGNLSALGSSFVIGDQEFKFDERPSRWVLSAGFLF